MLPSLHLVRMCHLDPATNVWSMGPARTDVTPDEVLDHFLAWDRARAASESS
jgi:hypothetical protein